MEITAAIVRALRERTGAGIMDCKKALKQTDGDIEKAIEVMRQSGAVKAADKGARIAAEGVILLSQKGDEGFLLEINCETDFVAKSDDFTQFANTVLDVIVEHQPDSLVALDTLRIGGNTIQELLEQLISKVGEKVSIRRFDKITSDQGIIGKYLHGNRIGVVLELTGGHEILAKDIAMHIAAVKPLCVEKNQVPEDILAKERKVYMSQALDSGKPDHIINKIVDGKIEKFLREVSLLEQAFVKDPEKTISQVLEENDASVRSFIRYEVGEGIEKKTDNFAEEVMAQAQT